MGILNKDKGEKSPVSNDEVKPDSSDEIIEPKEDEKEKPKKKIKAEAKGKVELIYPKAANYPKANIASKMKRVIDGKIVEKEEAFELVNGKITFLATDFENAEAFKVFMKSAKEAGFVTFNDDMPEYMVSNRVGDHVLLHPSFTVAKGTANLNDRIIVEINDRKVPVVLSNGIIRTKDGLIAETLEKIGYFKVK
jgi:hypothetical protein